METSVVLAKPTPVLLTKSNHNERTELIEHPDPNEHTMGNSLICMVSSSNKIEALGNPPGGASTPASVGTPEVTDAMTQEQSPIFQAGAVTTPVQVQFDLHDRPLEKDQEQSASACASAPTWENSGETVAHVKMVDPETNAFEDEDDHAKLTPLLDIVKSKPLPTKKITRSPNDEREQSRKVEDLEIGETHEETREDGGRN